MTIRILLIGGDGQVGWELQRTLAPLGQVLVAPRRGSDAVDLAEPDGLRRAVRTLRPDAIVNAAAWNAVDAAEADPAPAMAVNGEGPAVLAAEAAAVGALLVHYSTDQVLAGHGDRPQDESTATAPLNAYGRSKLAGEDAVRASGCRHLLLRTTWVHSARRPCFLRAMLARAATQDSLTVVADEVGAPTGADLVADVTAHALHAALRDDGLCGLYHCVARGETSRHAYVRFLLAEAAAMGLPLRASPDHVHPITSAAFAAPAERPLNARLDPGRLERSFGLAMPPWEDGVRRTLRQIAAATAAAAG